MHRYLDTWCSIHGFDGDKKRLPVYIIFVFDGAIDPCKTNRNKIHAARAEQLRKLAKKISVGVATSTDVKEFQKLRRKAVRFVGLGSNDCG